MHNQLDQCSRTLYSAAVMGIQRRERSRTMTSPLTWVAAPKQASKAPTANGEPFTLPELLGLEDANTFVPKENPLTAKKVELGRLLFFDKRMSKNNTIACASCHIPSIAFTDGQPVSTGIHRSQGGRSAPASINRVFT